MKRTISWMLAASLLVPATGCLRGGGFGLFRAALVTAVIVSAVQPPPPQVIIVPPPRDGYVWQPGYWTRQDDNWLWVDGGWVQQRPQAQYVPTHWEQTPDGQWTLAQAHWQ